MASERHREDQRRRLAHAAWVVIRRGGVAGATMREVAAEAGCTTGLISHHFRNRDELITYAFDLLVTELVENIQSRTAGEQSGLAKLRAFAFCLLAETAERDDMAVVTLASWAEAAVSPAFASVHQKNYRRLREVARGFAAEAVAQGEIDYSMSAEEVAITLFALADGLCVGGILEPESLSEVRCKTLIERYLSGLKLATAEKRVLAQ